MTIQTHNRKRSRRAIVVVVFVTIALIGGSAAWRWAVMLQRSDSRDLVHNWQKMNMVRLVLETVATEDYPAFCRLPTNTIIRTSPEFLAALPPTIREYFTLQAGMWGQDNVEKEGITDSWGNWYNM